MYERRSAYETVRTEATREQRLEYWEIAKGLQEIGNVSTSAYLDVLAHDHVEGRCGTEKVIAALRDQLEREESRKRRKQREADMVAVRIVEVLTTMAFAFTPAILLTIHRKLYQDVLPPDVAGAFREKNVTRPEPILGGECVKFADCEGIRDCLRYEFDYERDFKYCFPLSEHDVRHVARFASNVWQAHPFEEGNTQTLAVFLLLYMRSLGVETDGTPFKLNAAEFRNALVLSSQTNLSKGIYADPCALEEFMKVLVAADCEVTELNGLQGARQVECADLDASAEQARDGRDVISGCDGSERDMILW